MQSFRDLNCWKEARIFRNKIFELTKTFPAEEKYKLSDQIIRSSRGIGNAIAEGHGRFHYQENIQYCRIGRGSLEESLDHLITALDCKYITDPEYNEYERQYKSILALLNGYIAYLKKRKGGETN
jgi:four helix bundle protein